MMCFHQSSLSRYHWIVCAIPVSKLYFGFHPSSVSILVGSIELEKCYEKGVIFTPGDIFSIDDRCKSTLRLGLSRLNLNQIEEGIKIIGEVKKKLEK